jgi:phage terminase Nu1 subunit (DNA packaging protein)
MADDLDVGSFVVSTKQAAKLCRMSEERLRQCHVAGEVRQVERGKYLVDDLFAFMRSRVERKPAVRGSEHARLARAQARRVELENERRVGELLPADMVQETLNGAAATLRLQLESLPGRLASELALLTDAAVIRERIQVEVRAIRHAVVEFFEWRAVDVLEEAGEEDTHHGVNGHDREKG